MSWMSGCQGAETGGSVQWHASDKSGLIVPLFSPTLRATLGARWFVTGLWLVWCLGAPSPAPDPGAPPSTVAFATM